VTVWLKKRTQENILLVCPIYNRQRLKIYPEEAIVENMHWGTGDDLR
jgi:hypothetical protein